MSVSALEVLMHQAVERIWLVPVAEDGGLTFNWCDCPAPGEGMEPGEAVEYVRADVHRDEVERLKSLAALYAASLKQAEAERGNAPAIGTRYRNDAGEVMAVVVPAMASYEMREAGMHPYPVRAGHGHFQANMYLAMLAALPEPE